MRRMITSKQAKGLEKLNENININEDGTIVEVGGNVGFESAEQIGTTKIVEIPGYVEIKNDNSAWEAEKVIATGVTSIVELGAGWSTSSFLPTATTEGDVAFKDVATSHYLVLRIGETFYYTNVDGATIKVNSTATVVDESLATVIPSHNELEFTPLFKYEDGNIYMLNENGDYLLIGEPESETESEQG